jgi:alanyl-tRNA synthetase
MTSNEIRKRFLDFFEKRGHKILPSASLVPENDPSVLFNTAGMQPLVPYLMGQKHPSGTRLASCQKCVRTGDIDEVGDNRHLTFFEMLGNWSLGDYFKEESIQWSYEFLTDKVEGLGLDPNRIYVTVFEGDENAPRDNEAVEIWKKYMPENRIYFLPAKNNWWSPGDNGPCGPDTEIFYDVNDEPLGDMTHEQFVNADDEGRVVEIWNNVFMEYEKKDGKVIGKLAQKNVDTGMGLERITMVVQNKKNVFETDLFAPVIEIIKNKSVNFNDRSAKIIADHFRTALMMTSDGVIPGNKDKEYILRRIIRRATVKSMQLEMSGNINIDLLNIFINSYSKTYPNIDNNKNLEIIYDEIIKFKKTLDNGIKEFEKVIPSLGEVLIGEVAIGGSDDIIMSGEIAFNLYSTYGFPIELTQELAQEKGIAIDMQDFNTKMQEHQKLSQTASAGMFKGGLANHNEKTIQLHTAHHLLLAALQQVLGKSVKQRGSNITEERLRIDFMFDRKMTDEEKKQVEDIVNEKIGAGLSVIRKEMPLVEAEKLGAEMEFGAKYPEMVSVYSIEQDGTPFSIEFCGGPHINNTNELGHFKIQKEEAVSQGVRRIKAILE